jgi:hypothetical protein
MKRIRKVSAALALLALTLLGAQSAFAQSSHLYPASDTVSMGSAPITISWVLPLHCTFHGGSVVLPAKGTTSGPITMSYLERPSFTGCTVEGTPVTVATSENWTLSAEYGAANGKITIPAYGFEVLGPKGEVEMFNSQESISLNVGWNNGFSSPVSVHSALEVYGSPQLFWAFDGKYHATSFGSTLLTLTDVTHPASMPVLGP